MGSLRVRNEHALKAERPFSARRTQAWFERRVFESNAWVFCGTMLLIAVVRTGIWFIPNVEAWTKIASDPFTNPFTDGRQDYLLYNWLGPFVAWLLHATSQPTFLLLHAFVTVAGSVLLFAAAFRRFDDRRARVAVIIFMVLPVSTTTYYWVGTDAITVLLLIALVVVPRRPPILFGIGLFLGMQHFEQGIFAIGALLVAALLSREARHRLDLRVRPLAAALVGVITGRGVLIVIFRASDIEVRTDRYFWARELFSDLVEDFVTAPHLLLFSVLGVGWIVVIKYVLRGQHIVPLVVPLVALMTVLLLVFDQTRVLCIITMPLLLVFCVFDGAFIASLSDRFVIAVLVIWLLTPWLWVIGGRPQSSVTPYTVSCAVNKVAGLFDCPNDPNWPFDFELPDTEPILSSTTRAAGPRATADPGPTTRR